MTEETSGGRWTPGPWEEDAFGVLRNPSGLRVGDLDRGARITPKRHEQIMADRVLQKAAPDLYEALSGWDKLHADMVAAGGALEELSPHLIEQFAEYQRALMDATRAALLKAEGRGGE